MIAPRAKILLVLSRSIIPVDAGREVLLVNFVKRLLPYAEVHIVFFNNKNPSHAELLDKYRNIGVSSVSVLRKPSWGQVLKNLFLRFGTVQEAFFYSPDNESRIISIVRDKGISGVYFDMLRMYRYLLGVRELTSAKVIYDLDDLLSERYSFFLRSKVNPATILGSYADYFGSTIVNLLMRLLMRPILMYEAYHCSRRELDVSKVADVVLLTSPTERDHYKVVTAREHAVFTNFPIVKSSGYLRKPAALGGGLVWLGNNNVAHNYCALESLIENIVPKLPLVGLVVAGRTPDTLVSKYKGSSDVEFAGFVEDLDSILCFGKVLVAPFSFGTGVKIKLLEAMAKGVAVVTNDIGFQGIPHGASGIFRPCNSDVEMIDCARRLLSDFDYLSAWTSEQSKVLAENFSASYEAEIVELVLN